MHILGLISTYAALAVVLATSGFADTQFRQCGIDTSIIDYSVSPGDDFYSYASGRWLSSTKVPERIGGRYGYHYISYKVVERQRQQLLDGTATSEKHVHLSELVNDLYVSGLDTVGIEASGISALIREMDRIESIQDIHDFSELLAHLQLIGINPFFQLYEPMPWELEGFHRLYLKQEQLGLSQVNHYLSDSDANREAREKYQEFAIRLLQTAGVPEKQALQDVRTIMGIETRLASKAMSSAEAWLPKNTYHEYRLRDLQKLIGELDWVSYLEHLGVPDTGIVIVGQPKYFKELGKILRHYGLDEIKAYLRWVLVHRCANYLTEDFRTALISFKEDVENWRPNVPRNVLMTDLVTREMSDVLGVLYVEEFFDSTLAADVDALILKVREAFKKRLKSCEWISDKTRRAFIEKIDGMLFLTGGPDHVQDCSNLTIKRGSFLEKIFAVRDFFRKSYFKKLGSPISRAGWTEPAYSTRAWYNPNVNVVTIPAGAVKVSYYYDDRAWTYATLGSGIGHEMSHGFDKVGRDYDKDGNYKTWWETVKGWFSSEDKEFDRLGRQLVEIYQDFAVLDSIVVDGELTLNENIADLNGLNIALDAYLLSDENEATKVKSGFTGLQRFFLAYAQSWREVFTKDGLRNALNLPHAPPQLRTNGVVYNIPAFYDAFIIDSTAAMYRAPEDRVRIW